MGDLVNLRRTRKAKQREASDAAAAANRLRFGRPAALQKAADAEEARAQRVIEGHRLETGERK